MDSHKKTKSTASHGGLSDDAVHHMMGLERAHSALFFRHFRDN